MVGAVEQSLFPLPPHQGRVEVPDCARGPGHDPEEVISDDRFGLALGRHRLGSLHFYCVSHQTVSRSAQEDLPWGGGLFQTSGGVDGVAHHQPLLWRGVIDQHLARVDPGAGEKCH